MLKIDFDYSTLRRLMTGQDHHPESTQEETRSKGTEEADETPSERGKEGDDTVLSVKRKAWRRGIR